MKKVPDVIVDCQKIFKTAESVECVRNVVDGYFSKVMWSLEKKEWDCMTEEQKNQFCVNVFDKFSKKVK